MARGSNRSGQRESTPFSTPVLPVSPINNPLATASYLAQFNATQKHLQWMKETEDLRQFHPAQPIPARTVSGAISEFTRRPTFRARHMTDVLAFANPTKRVMVCLRRKIRKQVLHALLKTGGRGGGRPRKYNRNSKIRC